MIDHTNPLEEKFHKKFESVAQEFEIPFSRLSDLLGLSKNSIYALRKSHNWKPQNSWYVDKTKRLDAVRDLLFQYREFAIFHSKGKTRKYEATLFHQWVFSIWYSHMARDDGFIVSPLPLSTETKVSQGPPRPKTEKDILKEEINRNIAALRDLAANP